MEGLRAALDQFTASQREAIEREIGYFEEHKNRMDYKTGKELGQPVGSGAIESTCAQFQRRFDGLLAADTMDRLDRAGR